MEQDMSYIVVYQRADDSPGFEECADLDLAVVTAERLRNVDSVERPRILKTEEVSYDFKPYYRVEVIEAAASAAATAVADASTAKTATTSAADASSSSRSREASRVLATEGQHRGEG